MVRAEWNKACESLTTSYSKVHIIIKAIFLDVLWNLYLSNFFFYFEFIFHQNPRRYMKVVFSEKNEIIKVIKDLFDQLEKG